MNTTALWLALGSGCSGTDTTTGDSPTVSTDSAATDDTAGTTDTAPVRDSGETTGTLTQHGLVRCEDPDARQAQGPQVLRDHGEAWSSQQDPDNEAREYSVGVAVDDFDGDGTLDVFLAHTSGPQLFLGTADGQLLLSSERLPEPDVFDSFKNRQLAGALAADLDGDGDPDLVLGSPEAPMALWRNDLPAGFVDVSEDLGLEIWQLRAIPAGDLDGDGDLDLFLGSETSSARPPDPGQPNHLLENQGGLVLVDVSERLPAEDRHGYTMAASIVDLDGDGDQDLYVVNHLSDYQGNLLFWNDGTGALSRDPQAGLDVKLQGMGTGLGDLNGDGLPDLLVSSAGEFALFESQAVGLWARTEKVRGLAPDPTKDQESGWATALADLDNDGDLDVITGFSRLDQAVPGALDPDEQPDGLWLAEDGVFHDAATAWGLDQRRSTRGLVLADFNGDGWLDVLKTATNEPAALWTSRCGTNGWLQVDLAGPGQNTRGIGARVVVRAAGQVWTRWVVAGSTSYVSSTPPTAHFGLGATDTVEAVTVHWPDGTSDSWHDVPTRQRLTARHVDGR